MGGGGGTTEPGQISRGLADMGGGGGTTEPGGGVAPRSQARSVGAWPTWGGMAPRSQARSVGAWPTWGGGWHHGARPDQ